MRFFAELKKAYASIEAMSAVPEGGGVWIYDNFYLIKRSYSDICASKKAIRRFLEEKEDVTGIKFEPWHFRYVGKEIASYIMANGMTLEEFTEEAQEAVADFESRGGDVEEQLAYEYSRLNAPPESYVLDELGEDGDAEVSLVF